MENKQIVKEFFKARQEGDIAKLEALAVENVELVCRLLDMETSLVLDEYSCGTTAQPQIITAVKVKIDGKRVDARNKLVKQLQKYIDCWCSYSKQFVLQERCRKIL